MDLDASAAIVDKPDRGSTGPLAASLRWGFGWTIVAVTLGTTAACVSATPVDDPVEFDDSYSACVGALGEMPDAIEQHIDPCRAVAAAAPARR